MGHKRKKIIEKRNKLEARREAKKKMMIKTNPFEVQVNKQKHKVLGRKVMKWEIGKPLKSRHDAIKKRRETLLPELKGLNKSGLGLIDNRVKDAKGGVAARKAKLYDKFDIGEEEPELTHKGEKIQGVRFNLAPKTDDDDDDDLDLLRRGDYVESAHFGGGESGPPMSSKDFLEEVMVDKRKKQLEKEENIQLTEQLDKDWASVRSLIKHKGAKDEVNVPGNEDYDILLNQLMFGGMEEKPQPQVVESRKEKEEKPISMNVQLVENLRGMMSSDDVETIVKHIGFLLSFEVKRFNSTVTEKIVDFLNGKTLKKCTIKSMGFLMFTLTFKELKHYATIKLIEFLKVLKYDSTEAITRRIFICNVLHASSSDKYFPEIVISLQNIFSLCAIEHKSLFMPAFTFDKIPDPKILQCDSDMSFDDLPQISLQLAFGEQLKSISQPKSFILKSALELLERLMASYKRLDSFEAIFSKISTILNTLQEKLPKPLADYVYKLMDQLIDCDMLQYLTFERKPPPMITMLEPRLMTNVKHKNEKRRLARAYKKEFKSASRELRKDGAFIRDNVLKETLAKDEKRKQKVKKLMAEIAEERSMFKKKR